MMKHEELVASIVDQVRQKDISTLDYAISVAIDLYRTRITSCPSHSPAAASEVTDAVAGLKDEIADLRDEWQAEYDARLAANTARRAAEARISGLRAERITAERDALEAYRKLQAAEAHIAELEAAIDSAEIVGGLTENGNLWRFWSQKAQETAGKAEARISSLEQANEALMRERTSLIATHRESIDRLTKEREDARKAFDGLSAITGKMAKERSSLKEENKRLREARDEARRGEYAANEHEPTWGEITSVWKARAETAEQEAKALLDALNQVGLTPEQKSWVESFLKTRAFLAARQALEDHNG